MTARELTVDLEAVTPLFLGGANQDEPEARAASFRGALRFWWRALAAEPNLEQLRKREAHVFGDTGRASAVRVDVETIGPITPVSWQEAIRLPTGRLSEQEQLGLNYLGFALAQRRNTRKCLPAGTKLRVTLRLRRSADGEQLRQAVAALWLLVNLGGIGTRARRGFGSLAATSSEQLDGLPQWHFDGERTGHVATHLTDGLATLSRLGLRTEPVNQAVPYPILSPRHSFLVVLQVRSLSWQSALGTVGRLLAAFRASLFPRMTDLRSGGTTSRTPERAVFGLPIQFYHPGTRESYTLVAAGSGAPDRRASPLHIKAVRLAPDGVGIVLTAFTGFGAEFLPARVRTLRGGTLTIQAVPAAKTLGDFLTRLADRRQTASDDWPGSPGLIPVRVP